MTLITIKYQTISTSTATVCLLCVHVCKYYIKNNYNKNIIIYIFIYIYYMYTCVYKYMYVCMYIYTYIDIYM